VIYAKTMKFNKSAQLSGNKSGDIRRDHRISIALVARDINHRTEINSKNDIKRENIGEVDHRESKIHSIPRTLILP